MGLIFTKDSGDELLSMVKVMPKLKMHHAGDGAARRMNCSLYASLFLFIYFLDDHASEVHRRYSVASESGHFFSSLEYIAFKDIFKNDAGMSHGHLA